jgi:hypothetical protein
VILFSPSPVLPILADREREREREEGREGEV